MPLQAPPTNLIKDSFLVFGVQSAGKTRSWATIRKWYELTGASGHFYIISTEAGHAERTAQAYLDGTLGNNFFSNASITTVTDYDTLVAESEKIRKDGTGDDWIIIDSIGWPQQWARDRWFRDNHNGMTWRQFQNAGHTVQEVKSHEWGQMTDLYRDWLVPNILEFPGYRLATAHLKEIRTEGLFAEKNRNIISNFGPHGVQPDGDKDLLYGFNSIFLMKRARDGWRITTVDDPEREYLEDAPITDFVQDVLMDVAGWQVT